MSSNSLGVVFQFTDCHLFDPDAKADHKGIDTNASFIACLQGAKKTGIPDLLVISGDLSHDESLASYCFLAESINQFFPDTRCLIQPGNHDNRETMQQVFPYHHCEIQKYFRFEHWLIYMLETISTKEGWFHAKIPDEVYQDLNQLSHQDDIKNMLVFMHYNLVNIEFRDIKCGIIEAEKLRQALLKTGKVRCISSGHIHQEYHYLDNGIIYTSTPPTGIQSRLANGQESQEWIGFKRFELFNDGNISLDSLRIRPPLRFIY